MEKPKCLKQWQLLIKKQIPLISKKPLAELIIYCSLKKVKEKYGEKGVSKIMERLNLRKLGFKLND